MNTDGFNVKLLAKKLRIRLRVKQQNNQENRTSYIVTESQCAVIFNQEAQNGSHYTMKSYVLEE